MNIANYLPGGLSGEDFMVLLAAVAAFLVVIAVWFGLLERESVGPRLRALAARQRELQQNLRVTPRRARDRDRGMTFMREVVNLLKLRRQETAADIGDKLAQAGWRSRDAVIVYLFARVAVPLFAGGGSVFYLYGLGATNLQPMTRLLVAAGCVIVSYLVPDILVKNQADKRRHALRKALPDALDLMVVCAEAGSSLDATLTRVSREMQHSSAELSEELGLTSIELGFLPERRKALENLQRRTNLAALSAVVNTLMQTERYGTPLAQSLRVLSNEFRNERMMRAEEKAARLPALLTVPLILFILPALFVVLIGPAIIRVLDSFKSLK